MKKKLVLGFDLLVVVVLGIVMLNVSFAANQQDQSTVLFFNFFNESVVFTVTGQTTGGQQINETVGPIAPFESVEMCFDAASLDIVAEAGQQQASASLNVDGQDNFNVNAVADDNGDLDVTTDNTSESPDDCDFAGLAEFLFFCEPSGF